VINTFTVLKSLHVLGATVWIGGAFFIQVLFTVISRQGVTANTGDTLRMIGTLGERIFIPASLTLFAAGLWLTLKYDYIAFDQFWIQWGIGVWVMSFIAGAGYLGPASKKGGALLEAGDLAAYEKLLKPVMLVSRIEIVLLLATVVIMVTRP
jgi:uncharacterized membrane protein